jgi:hypothetical protein
MCHEWWQMRMYEQREASRKLWEEFERTEPLSEPEPAEEEIELTLEEPEEQPAATKR